MFLFLFCLIILCCASSNLNYSAQSESAKPTFGVKLDREVALAKIEKETYQDVIVELRSADLGDLFTEGVKIIVKDAKTGKNL